MLKFFSTPASTKQKVSVMLTSKVITKVVIVEVGTPTELTKLMVWADTHGYEWEFNSDLCWAIQCVMNYNESK